MRKILAGMFVMALAATLSIAAPPQDRDDRHDNGKHKGRDKHEDRGDDRDRHDNGKHKGWDNPHNPHANWDSDHDRIQPGRAHPHGRYDHVREVIVARRIDYRTRRVVLYDNSNWVVEHPAARAVIDPTGDKYFSHVVVAAVRIGAPRLDAVVVGIPVAVVGVVRIVPALVFAVVMAVAGATPVLSVFPAPCASLFVA